MQLVDNIGDSLQAYIEWLDQDIVKLKFIKYKTLEPLTTWEFEMSPQELERFADYINDVLCL